MSSKCQKRAYAWDHDRKVFGSLLPWLRPACRHHHKQMLHAPALGNALLWSYVAAYAFNWDGITLLAPIATDREAAHVQVAVVQSFASEVPQRATLARIMAAMGLSREVRSSCASRRYASWV